ncbi:MAG: FAD-dependent monooxygenase [Burkholderiaceae bacterium]
MTTEHYPVAIVGAGPVGLTVANLLALFGVSCILIERSPGTSTHPRAQTIDDESLRTLQTFGGAPGFEHSILPAQGSNYYDKNGDCFAQVGAGPKNYGFFKRNYMLQQQLDAALLARLETESTVTRRFGTLLQSFVCGEAGVELVLDDDQRVHCDYLLACDGGQSAIRKALEIAMQGWTYEQDWIVLDALDDPDAEPISRFYCNPERPAVSIASPGGGRRYEFMLLPGEDREAVLTDESLAQILSPFRPWQAEKITRRAVYTFHARIAERLQHGRVFLLGDAAHLTPPFAGQGMNAGIRDAQNIAWKLAMVCKHGAGPKLLTSYEQERRKPIWQMIQLAVAMGEFVMPVGHEQVALKNSVLKALERFPQARDWLFQMRFKPRPRYEAGVFVDLDEQGIEASLVGEMLPQPKVVQANGTLCLLDDLLGPGFCLLVQDEHTELAASRLDGPIWQTIQAGIVRLSFDEEETSGASDVISARVPRGDEIENGSENLLVARPLRSHRGQIVLVRPDRYVLGACFVEELDGFAGRLDDLFELAGQAGSRSE